MSINNRFGIDENRVKRFGKNYSSIDFDIKENLNAEDDREKIEEISDNFGGSYKNREYFS